MGTQPFPEIHAAQYDNALHVSSGLMIDLRRDVVPDTPLGDLAWYARIGNLLIRDVYFSISDMVLQVSYNSKIRVGLTWLGPFIFSSKTCMATPINPG